MRFPFRQINTLEDAQRNFEYLESRLAPTAVVLVAGTATVVNSAVTANSMIILSHAALGGTPGDLSYVITPGTGFVINSSSVTDTSTINYLIL